MLEGRIAWFDHGLGAGFIRTERKENVFFCTGVVENGACANIRGGQHVTFDVMEKWNGISPAARNVKICDIPL